MVSKRHGKDKRPSLSKKSKARQRQVAIASRQQVTAPIMTPPEVAVTAEMPAPPAVVKKPKITLGPRYPYITAELKRIGILAGIILGILIVLALVLS